MKGELMKKTHKQSEKEFDFHGGTRGKYAKRYSKGTNVIVLEPGVARYFRDSKSVNDALRALTHIIKHK